MVNYPIFSLFSLRHWATIKFYYIKRLCKIYFMSLNCSCSTIVFNNSNPFAWIIQIYTSRTKTTVFTTYG